MEIKGLDNLTMSKLFYAYIKQEDYVNVPQKFHARMIAFSKKGNVNNSTTEEIANAEEKFMKDTLLLYLKTFYGKKPSDFSNPDYQREAKELAEKINNLPNKQKVILAIENAIKENNITQYQKMLSTELFGDDIKYISLDADNSDTSFFSTNFSSQARIYVNPSTKDYGHFISFLYEKAATKQLDIRTKTRLLRIKKSTSFDNLIIYTTDKSFPHLLLILDEYAKLYPEKVKEFGTTPAAFGRTEHEWFGIGFEPQKKYLDPKSQPHHEGISTFNSFIDNVFGNYIMPAIWLEDFPDIFASIPREKMVDALTTIFSDKKTAENFLTTITNKPYGKAFLKNFCDLSKVKSQSDQHTKEMKMLPKDHLHGLDPTYVRKANQSDDYIMMKEEIECSLVGSEKVKLTREKIAKFFTLPIIRDAITEYYNNNANEIADKIRQMSVLWENIGKNFPFVSTQHPFLSIGMERELRKVFSDKILF